MLVIEKFSIPAGNAAAMASVEYQVKNIRSTKCWIDQVAVLSINGIAMTNSVAATVKQDERWLFDGQARGICGDATRSASIKQTELFSRLIAHRGLTITIVGVGGVSQAAHVHDYLKAGADHVQIASAAMVDPEVAIKIRQKWNDRSI